MNFTCNPIVPAPEELAEIIAIHREMFGGFTMQDEAPDEQPADKPEAPQQPDGFKSEHSKQSVLADLAKERDERQKLAAQVEQLAPLQKLLDVIAPDAKSAENPADAALRALEERIAASEKSVADANHRALVAEHGSGLDDADKAIISKITDPALMGEIAARLREAAASNQPSTFGRRIPKPDPTVGSGVDAKSSSVAAGRDLYKERRSNN